MSKMSNDMAQFEWLVSHLTIVGPNEYFTQKWHGRSIISPEMRNILFAIPEVVVFVIVVVAVVVAAAGVVVDLAVAVAVAYDVADAVDYAAIDTLDFPGIS